jgi:hypothetical protein
VRSESEKRTYEGRGVGPSLWSIAISHQIGVARVAPCMVGPGWGRVLALPGSGRACVPVSRVGVARLSRGSVVRYIYIYCCRMHLPSSMKPLHLRPLLIVLGVRALLMKLLGRAGASGRALGARSGARVPSP